MLMPQLTAGVLSFSVLALSTGMACGETYPSKPLRVITGEPGGGNDFASRLVAQGISAGLGQNVIVDNRPIFRVEEFVSKAPDGYTLLVIGSSLWITTLLQKMPYDPVRDLSPVAMLVRSPNVLVVHPSL